jgi:hypothetical protein
VNFLSIFISTIVLNEYFKGRSCQNYDKNYDIFFLFLKLLKKGLIKKHFSSFVDYGIMCIETKRHPSAMGVLTQETFHRAYAGHFLRRVPCINTFIAGVDIFIQYTYYHNL